MLKPASGRRHPAITLAALAYADNVAITRDSSSGDERTLRRLQCYSEVVGLKLNAAKTKGLLVGFQSDPKTIFTLDGTMIDLCDIFHYLGLPTLSSKVAMRQRFFAAWSAIRILCPIFHLTAPNTLKVQPFKSAVKMIDSYALESIPLNPMTSNMLDAGHRQMICAALGINWRTSSRTKKFMQNQFFCRSVKLSYKGDCLTGHSL